MQRLETILAQKAAPKEPEWPSYGNLGKLTQNPHFSSHLKGPTALWPKWHYPLISMQLKCKDWTIFWREKQLQNWPNSQGMAIFARSPKTRIF